MAVLTAVAAPSAAVAACVEPTAELLLARAAEGERTVFVGEVIGGFEDRPRLRVIEVWSGPDLAPEVTVRTGPDQLPWPLSRFVRSETSLDADLDLAVRYVVSTHGDFATDACSSLLADADVRAQAPSDARPPTADGLRGHRPGLFDTALGATVLGLMLLVAGVWVWGRRLDANDRALEAGTVQAAGRGVIVGALVGLAGAALAELATYATLQLFPTDVAIFGFGVAVGVPASAAVGALCWWLGRPSSHVRRLVAITVPVVLVGVWQVYVQWASQ